jgi:hypothetical protein
MRRKKSSSSIFKSGGNIPVIASIIVLIAFIAGLLLGTLVVAKSFAGKGGSSGTYADGYNAAKEKLKGSNLPGVLSGEIRGLSGQVKSVSGNKIVFTAPLINPLWDDSLKTRTAIVDDKTVIMISTPLSPAEAQANQAAGQKQFADLRSQIDSLNTKVVKCSPGYSASSTCGQERTQLMDLQGQMMSSQRLMMPAPKQATGTIADIKVGQNISVSADQNISELAQFTAKQIFITVIDSSSVPTTPNNSDVNIQKSPEPTAAQKLPIQPVNTSSQAVPPTPATHPAVQ